MLIINKNSSICDTAVKGLNNNILHKRDERYCLRHKSAESKISLFLNADLMAR